MSETIEHGCTLNDAQVAYLLRLVRDDIALAIDRGEGDVNIVLHNMLWNMSRRSDVSPREGT